jgi:hypothetical protein
MENAELEKHLIDSSKRSEKVIIWNFSLGSFHFIEYHFKTIRRDRNDMVFEPATGFLNLEGLKQIITGSGRLNIYLEESKIFVRTHFKSIDEKYVITTSLPDLSMKEERRSEERLLISNIDVNLLRNGKIEKGVLSDISTGGASLFLTERKSTIPQVEDEIEDLHLISEELKKLGSAKVVAVRKIPPYQEQYPFPVWKISLSFDTQLNLTKYLKEL